MRFANLAELYRRTAQQAGASAESVIILFLRALRSALRDASPGAPAAVRDAQLGGISFPQRLGGSLNPHYHYHVLALDGVISGDIEHGVRFHEATSLKARDAETLARTVQLRVLRWFTRRGTPPPSPTSQPVARPDAADYLASAPERAFGPEPRPRAPLPKLVPVERRPLAAYAGLTGAVR